MSWAIQSCILEDGCRLSAQMSPPSLATWSGSNPCATGLSSTRVNVSHDEKSSVVASVWSRANWWTRVRRQEFQNEYGRSKPGSAPLNATPTTSLSEALKGRTWMFAYQQACDG